MGFISKLIIKDLEEEDDKRGSKFPAISPKRAIEGKKISKERHSIEWWLGGTIGIRKYPNNWRSFAIKLGVRFNSIHSS